MPSLRELQSLMDYSRNVPALPADHLFTDVQPNDRYWSCTTFGAHTPSALYVQINYGYVGGADKAAAYPVWPVRGGG